VSAAAPTHVSAEAARSWRMLVDRIGTETDLRRRANLEAVAAGADVTHPYLSPIFADFGAGFPPTYIQSGTRDLFLSNRVRLHRALRNGGVEAELHVWEAGLHGGYRLTGAPEAAEEHEEQARFLARHWLGRAPSQEGSRADR
jgi:monoterpene epsilon-lactone hydrolase